MVQLYFGFLKPYFKNIDIAQLNFMLFRHGRVVLENLQLADEILDKVNVVFRLVVGQIRKVEIEIVSWHRLFSSQINVTVDGINLLLEQKRPTSRDDIEQRFLRWRAKKQQHIAAIEEKIEQDSEEQLLSDDEEDQVKPLGWIEKIMLTLIKNVQLTINNVHIRYEDHHSVPSTTFAVGCMLESLKLQSFHPDNVESLTERFFKSIQFNNFCVYMDLLNHSQKLHGWSAMSETQKSTLIQQMASNFNVHDVSKHECLVSPMSFVAHLKVNTHPEFTSFKDPILDFQLNVNKLSLGLNQEHYQSLVRIFDFSEQPNERFWKYRPNVPCRGKTAIQKWWVYAITCVMEENRGFPSLSTNEMTKVLQMAKEYRQLYLQKLSGNLDALTSAIAIKSLTALEDQLEPVTIVLQRCLAKKALQRSMSHSSTLSSPTNETKKSTSWWSYFFTSRGTNSNDSSWYDVATRELESTLTNEDKSQLIEQIGSDSSFNQQEVLSHPDSTAYQLGITLSTLEIALLKNDDTGTLSTNLFTISNSLSLPPRKVVVNCKSDMLSSQLTIRRNGSIRLQGKCEHLWATGLDDVPLLDAPIKEAASAKGLIKIDYDSNFDQTGERHLEIESQLAAFTYHSATIKHLTELFNQPESQSLNELAAETAYEVKEKSVAFAKSVIENRHSLSLNVKIRGGYLIVPERGDVHKATQLLVIDFGSLSMRSEDKQFEEESDADELDTSTVRAMMSLKSQAATLENLRKNSYKKLHVSVKYIQAFLCNKDSKWWEVDHLSSSTVHLLQPLFIKAMVGLCVIKDPRLPKTTLELSLDRNRHPSGFCVETSSSTLRNVLELIRSIPSSDHARQTTQTFVFVASKRLTTSIIDENDNIAALLLKPQHPATKHVEIFVDLDSLTFQVTDEEVGVHVWLSIHQPRFGLNIDAHLTSGHLTIQSFYLQHQKSVSTINNVIFSGEGLNNSPFFETSFALSDPSGPDYGTVYQQHEIHLTLNFNSAEVLLYHEAVSDMMKVLVKVSEIFYASSSTRSTENRFSIISLDAMRSVASSAFFPTKPKADKPMLRRCFNEPLKERSQRVQTFYIEGKMNVLQIHLQSDRLGHFSTMRMSKTNLSVLRSPQTSAATFAMSQIDIDTFTSKSSIAQRFFQSVSSQSSSENTLSLSVKLQRNDGRVDATHVVTLISGKLTGLRCLVIPQFFVNLADFSLAMKSLYVELFASPAIRNDTVLTENEPQSSTLEKEGTFWQNRHNQIIFDVTVDSPVLFLSRNLEQEQPTDCIEASFKHFFLNYNKNNEAQSNLNEYDSCTMGVEGASITRFNVPLVENLFRTRSNEPFNQTSIVDPFAVNVDVKHLTDESNGDRMCLKVIANLPTILINLCRGDFLLICETIAWISSELMEPLTSASTPQPLAMTVKNQVEASVSVHCSEYSEDSRLSAVPTLARKISELGFHLEGLIVRLFSGNTTEQSAFLMAANVCSIDLSFDNFEGADKLMGLTVGEVTVKDPQDQIPLRMLCTHGKMDNLSYPSSKFAIIRKFQQSGMNDCILDIDIGNIVAIYVPKYVFSMTEFFGTTSSPAIKPSSSLTRSNLVVYIRLALSRLLFVRNTPSPSLATTALQFEISSSPIIVGDEDWSARVNMRNMAVYIGSFEKVSTSADVSNFQCLLKPMRSLRLQINRGPNNLRIIGESSDATLSFKPSCIRAFADAIGQVFAITSNDYTMTVPNNIAKNNGAQPLLCDPSTELGKPYPVSQFNLYCFDQLSSQIETRPAEVSLNSIPIDVFCSIPSLTVKFSSSAASEKMVPLVQLRSMINLGMKISPSSNLKASIDFDLEIAYYNTQRHVWEPLLEPVECSPSPIFHPLQRPLDSMTRHRRAKFTMLISRQGVVERSVLQTPHFTFDETSPLVANMSSGDVPDSALPLTIPKPFVTVAIDTKEMLQLVLTKTGIAVLTNVISSFNEAFDSTNDSKPFDELSVTNTGTASHPVQFFNFTDTTFTIRPGSFVKFVNISADRQSGLAKHHNFVTLASNNVSPVTVDLLPTSFKVSTMRPFSTREKREKLMTTEAQRSYTFYIETNGCGEKVEMTVTGASCSQFHIGGTPYLFHVGGAGAGVMTITLTTTVKILNHTTEPICVFANLKPASVFEVQPGKIRYLPFAPQTKLYIKPSSEQWLSTSIKPIHITDSTQQSVLLFTTAEKDAKKDPLFLSVLFEAVPVKTNKGYSKIGRDFHVHVANVITVRNLLPFAILVSDGVFEKEEQVIEPGLRTGLRHSRRRKNALVSVRLPSYKGVCWSAKLKTELAASALGQSSPLHFKSSEMNEQLELAVFASTEESGTCVLSLYAPYWVVNCTGLSLQYKIGYTVFQHSDKEKTALVAITEEDIDRRKIQIKADESLWSRKVPMDAVGSVSTIICEYDNQESPVVDSTDNYLCCSGRLHSRNKYLFGMAITLSSSSLTKVMTITPYYFFFNKCPFPIDVEEQMSTHAKVYSLKPDECIPFWPRMLNQRKQQLVITLKDTGLKSCPFNYSQRGSTVLKFDSTFRGITVTTSVYEGAVHVVFENYVDGMAPLLIINCTQSMWLEYFQDNGDASLREMLQPSQGLLFHWPKPHLLEKELKWVPHNDFSFLTTGNARWPRRWRHPTCNIVNFKDRETDSFRLGDSAEIYWVTFIDKFQRILMFTEDKNAVKRISKSQGNFEQLSFECALNVKAVGISMVDDDRQLELIYVGILPTSNTWEYQRLPSPGDKPAVHRFAWKLFEEKQAKQLESEFQKWSLMKNNADDETSEILFGTNKVDLNLMRGVRNGNPIVVRRLYRDGLSFRIGFARNCHYEVFLKLNHVQIDNQNPESSFSTALLSTVPASSKRGIVAEYLKRKPFFELSLVVHQQPGSQMLVYKYLKVLIQEMAVKVDLVFLSHLYSFFTPSSNGGNQEETFRKSFQMELGNLAKPLENCFLGPNFLSGTKHFFESLHISPLKIRLSFSPVRHYGDSLTDHQALIGDVGSFALSSIGLFTGEIREALFHMDFFERSFALMTWPQFINDLWSHYSQYALAQFHSVILGLDVLGNPANVARGVASGVENLLCEPIQGAIEGPGQLVVGIAKGLSGCFGKSISSFSGGFSRITGTIGHAVARLAFDPDFQKARRIEKLRVKSSPAQNCLSGLSAMKHGFLGAIVGLVLKPVKGARLHGVIGCFQGLGIATAGIVVRPVVGIFDCLSTSFDTIQRMIDGVADSQQLRPPRLIGKDGTIRPYQFAEAQVNSIMLLSIINNGRKMSEHAYISHLLLENNGEQMLVATENCLYCLATSEVLCKWEVQSSFEWVDVESGPYLESTCTDNSLIIVIMLRDGRKLRFEVGKLENNENDGNALLEQIVNEFTAALATRFFGLSQ